MNPYVAMKNLLNLNEIHDFPHLPPTGDHFYEEVFFKTNVIAIFLVYRPGYLFNGNDPHRTIWGFVKYKRAKGSTTHTYHAPINSNKIGNEIDVKNTTPYTSMQLNLTPLELAYVQTKD